MEKQPRIATYVSEETIAKFKIVAALHGKSMSKYLEDLIEKEIKEHKIDDISNSNISSKSYVLRKNRYTLLA